MDKLFPKMRECPEGKHIALGGAYWIVYQIALPFILTMFCGGLGAENGLVIGCVVAHFVINLACTIVIFRSYLVESFWIVRMETKRVLVNVGLGLAALAVLEIPFVISSMFAEDPVLFFALPLADPVLGLFSTGWVMLNPFIFGPCMVFLAPVTMCCLYYAVGFAAPAQERPWLGYLIVALIAAVPAVLLYTSDGYELSKVVSYYFSVLPFHLCACWVYQRSDTIWGPIIFQAIANLVSIPVCIMTMLSLIFHSVF